MTGPKPNPTVLEIAPYKGGRSSLPGDGPILKLSSNENPAGPSPAAIDALRDAATNMHRYPSTDHAELRGAIAQVYGLDQDRMICGQGSDEIISFLCYAYGGPGSEIIYTEHGFSMYRISALAAGSKPVQVGETERRVDAQKILDGVTDKTRLVFVTNPGNPTGTMMDPADLQRLADELPKDILLVLDGAYAEFADGYDGGAALVEARENVVMLRTFSKLYGLGGLRVGWGYAPVEIIDVLNRVRGPFNLGVTQLCAAQAAVCATDWADAQVSENAKNRKTLAAGLASIGIPSDPSHTNYILARFKDKTETEAANNFLLENRIIVRLVPGYGFPNALRITVGTEQDCAQVVRVLTQFKELPQ